MSDHEHDPEVDEPVIDHEAIMAGVGQHEEDAGAAPRSMASGVRGIKPLFIIGPIALLIVIVVVALIYHGRSGASSTTTSSTSATQQLANSSSPFNAPGATSPLGGNPQPSATPQMQYQANGCPVGYDPRYRKGEKLCLLHGQTLPGIGSGTAGSAPAPTPNPCPPNYSPQLVGGQMACVPNAASAPSTGTTTTTTTTGTSFAPTPIPTATPLPPTTLNLTDDAQTRADAGVQPTPTPPVIVAANQQQQGTNGQQQSTGSAYAQTPQGSFVSNQQIMSAQTYNAAQNDQYLASSTQGVGYRVQQTADQLGIGTTIPYELETCVNSDLPGGFLARTTAPVFDSHTHRHVVIPSGTLLAGTYDDRLVPDQNGVLGVVTGMRFQDGTEFDLPSEVMANGEGETGLYGDVNRHVGQLYTSAFLLTGLGAISAALTPQNGNVLAAPSLGQQISSAAGAQVANLGTQLVSRVLSRPPTITVCPPYSGVVVVMHDLPLNRYRVGGDPHNQTVEYRVEPIGTVQRRFVAPLAQPRQLPIMMPVATPSPQPTPRGGALEIPAYPTPTPRR